MSDQTKEIGKRVVDIGPLVSLFEAQEGEIQHIIGKTGNGKTYEGTRRALEYLEQGYNVYTTWQLILPHYYDERLDKSKLFWRTLLFQKTFFRIDYKKNWHFLDIDRPDLIEFVSSLTDCVVLMDEGQDIFDSRERIDRKSRQVLTRMRHFRKTLIIISQRAQAVDVTARANVTFFFKCVKTRAWYWPFKTYFKIYRTEEMDQTNFPIWEDLITGWTAEVWRSGFAENRIYNAYNSWYLRAGIPRSQQVFFDAFTLTTWEKLKAFFSFHRREKEPEDIEQMKRIEKENAEDYTKVTTLSEKTRKKLSTALPVDKKKNVISSKHGKTKRRKTQLVVYTDTSVQKENAPQLQAVQETPPARVNRRLLVKKIS
jgi:hypothetical protein